VISKAKSAFLNKFIEIVSFGSEFKKKMWFENKENVCLQIASKKMHF
jgi:hypothetical protein